jgi:hypothetical protein
VVAAGAETAVLRTIAAASAIFVLLIIIVSLDYTGCGWKLYFRQGSESCQMSHTGGDCKTPGLFPAVDSQRVIPDSVLMDILSKLPGNKSCWALVSSLKNSSTLRTLDDHCVGEGQETA